MNCPRFRSQLGLDELRRAAQQFPVVMGDRIEHRAFLGPFCHSVLPRKIRKEHRSECAPAVILRPKVPLGQPPPVEDGGLSGPVERRPPVHLRDLAELSNHVGVRGEAQNRAVYRGPVFPSEQIVVLEVDRPDEIEVEIDPGAQTLRLHRVAKEIRAQGGRAAFKIMRKLLIRNHFIRVTDLDPAGNSAKLSGSIRIERE